MKTIDKIITKVDGSRGAPMGRANVIPDKWLYIDRMKLVTFDCAVPMCNDGAYDKGGAYWGTGRQLRVKYTKDLSYIEFYRKG